MFRRACQTLSATARCGEGVPTKIPLPLMAVAFPITSVPFLSKGPSPPPRDIPIAISFNATLPSLLGGGESAASDSPEPPSRSRPAFQRLAIPPR